VHLFLVHITTAVPSFYFVSQHYYKDQLLLCMFLNDTVYLKLIQKYVLLGPQVGGWMQGRQLCSVKGIIVVKSKKVKTQSNVQNLLRKAVAQKVLFCQRG
jgi:hypothetical protein